MENAFSFRKVLPSRLCKVYRGRLVGRPTLLLWFILFYRFAIILLSSDGRSAVKICDNSSFISREYLISFGLIESRVFEFFFEYPDSIITFLYSSLI